jgi:hypothetical protein
MSTDDRDFERASRLFGSDLAACERIVALIDRALNPEVAFHVPAPTTRVIDLQRKYDIGITKLPTLFSQPDQWEAIDRVTFDPDPESRWHIKGRGDSIGEATSDLLAQIAEQVAS